ncbi:MAG: DNA-directed RNA polymerase subunit omega [Oscillospiraceae bacterium]|nr:DNA-directed RNA polymerase subunit omega [Oscillospiraceae bacterium]MBR2897348.1 DNA-directed RNA polymerase subunit omega [Oscillospiraceae bacterium]MBR2977609.1 DNA-directed RNA polymerase subunit omega [Oscillospiraceae bacterium]MBR3850225.1 DNA-directed RNA polymerase subunit omega [Oscillospiraceae bacterium]
MLYPPIADLLKNVESRYLLVNVVARRARQLSIESELTHEPLPEKSVTLAIREVARGELVASMKDEYRK